MSDEQEGLKNPEASEGPLSDDQLDEVSGGRNAYVGSPTPPPPPPPPSSGTTGSGT